MAEANICKPVEELAQALAAAAAPHGLTSDDGFLEFAQGLRSQSRLAALYDSIMAARGSHPGLHEPALAAGPSGTAAVEREIRAKADDLADDYVVDLVGWYMDGCGA